MIIRKRHRPPRFPKWLLHKLEDYQENYLIAGDLEEALYAVASERGYRFAVLWFWIQVFYCLIRYVIYQTHWSLSMVKNYLRIAFRNLMKQKMYSAITIVGLAVGFGVFLFFFRFYLWALNADKFHDNADRIYTVVQVFDTSHDEKRNTTDIPYPLIPELKLAIPEIEDATRLYWPGRMIVEGKDEPFYESGMLFVDPNFLSFFHFNTIAGNPEIMLSGHNKIVLTRSTAWKYFGDASPIGKTLTLNNLVNVTVSGIVEDVVDIGTLSTIHFEFLVSMETGRALFDSMDDWSNHHQTGFVRLIQGTQPGDLKEKFDRIVHKYYPDDPDAPTNMYLFPMKDIAFKARHIQEYYGSDYFLAYIFLFTIGILFLLIVSINFVNLSTARYTDRMKEVGLRKVVGAFRSQLIFQFLGESVLMALVSLPLAALSYRLFCSAFSARVGISFDFSLWSHIPTIVAFFLVSFLTGILSGLYPALFLSSFRSAHILKNKLQGRSGRGRLRKLLVIFQFTISAMLILLAIVWMKQATFVYEVDFGYDRKNIIVLPLSDEARRNRHILKEMSLQHPEVTSVSASLALPVSWRTMRNVIPEDKTETESMSISVFDVDYDFVDVLDMHITQGRDFSREYEDDHNFIINQLMVHRLGWENPVGSRLKVGDEEGTVVGVVEDFQFDVLFYPMAPAIIALEREDLNYLLVEFERDESLSGIVEHIRKQWNAMIPSLPFEYFTLEDYFDQRHFGGSKLISEIIGIVGIIAIFFSCLGLVGLASYSARKRTKEIGIRKVLGASATSILKTLGKDFLKLVVISNIIALPIAYLVSMKLLDFAYSRHITIGPDIVILPVVITLLTAVSAIVSQTLKTAFSNPADSLRYE